MNREWTTEDELRHENRRLASEVAELRVRAEAAEAWCASWKRGAGISSRERDVANASVKAFVAAARLEGYEPKHEARVPWWALCEIADPLSGS